MKLIDKSAGKGSAYFKPGRAKAYLEALEGIKAAGLLTAERVEQAARSPKSPIHECFEWDASKAAANFRLQQARQLIAHVYCVVSVRGPNGKSSSIEARVFHRVTDRVQGKNVSHYVTVEEVGESERYREEVIEEALAQALSWKARWGRYKELWPIASAIRSTARRLKRSRAA